MSHDWKSLAALLPKQPCDDLMQDTLSGIYDGDSALGESLILFHRESVETADESLFFRTMDAEAWAKFNASRKRRWGARCTCSMCGEEFIAGYSNRRAGAPGIVLTQGDDGVVYDGYAEPGETSFEYFEGETVTCPRCFSYGTLTHRKKLRQACQNMLCA